MTLALHHSSQVNRNDFSTISALDLYHAIYCGKIIKQPLIITIRGRAMYVDPFCFQTNPFFQLLSQFTYYVGAPCKSERLFLFTIHNILEHLFVVNSFSEHLRSVASVDSSTSQYLLILNIKIFFCQNNSVCIICILSKNSLYKLLGGYLL